MNLIEAIIAFSVVALAAYGLVSLFDDIIGGDDDE